MSSEENLVNYKTFTELKKDILVINSHLKSFGKIFNKNKLAVVDITPIIQILSWTDHGK